jgi:8-oxo-dGTP pyrophosphatase MutT (NUDIX family)
MLTWRLFEPTDAGQAALPGGKAESLAESPAETARREAFEEIGLPLSDDAFPPPFRIHHLCQMPMNLARTEIGVRPVIAWIEAVAPLTGSAGAWPPRLPTAEDVLIPRLDAKEVAAVFTAPFEAFLSRNAGEDEPPGPAGHLSDPPAAAATGGDGGDGASDDDDATAWYSGQWVTWNGSEWRMHNFYVPSADQRVAWAEPPATTMTMNRFRVFGMTARILVDAARVAFGREPDFDHNVHFGDEDMIGMLIREGKLGDQPKRRYDGSVPTTDGNADRKAADSGPKM